MLWPRPALSRSRSASLALVAAVAALFAPGRPAPARASAAGPALVARELALVPAPTSVFVAFELDAAARFEIRIGRAGDPAPQIRTTAGPARYHRGTVAGLEPDRAYWLAVQLEGDAFALRPLPFRTPAAVPPVPDPALLTTRPDLAPGILEALTHQVDDQAVPAIAACIRGRPGPEVGILRQLLTTCSAYRHPLLGEALVTWLPGTHPPGILSQLLRIIRLSHCENGPAAILAAENVVDHYGLAEVGLSLVSAGDAGACDRIAAIVERGHFCQELPQFMARRDPDRARSWFTRWLASGRRDELGPGILLGLQELGTTKDLEVVSGVFGGPGGARGAGAELRLAAMEALAGSATPLARQVLEKRLEIRPDLALLWAVARAGGPEAGAVLARICRTSPDTRHRRDGLLALGLVGARDEIPFLRSSLSDRDATIRDAACWSLARLEDRSAAGAVLALAMAADRDPMGFATYAAGELGGEAEAIRLESLVDRHWNARTEIEGQRLALAAWAAATAVSRVRAPLESLMAQEDPGSRGVSWLAGQIAAPPLVGTLDRLAADPNRPLLVRTAARLALERLAPTLHLSGAVPGFGAPGAPSPRRIHVLFPGILHDRPGVHLTPGEGLAVAVEGALAYPEEPALTPIGQGRPVRPYGPPLEPTVQAGPDRIPLLFSRWLVANHASDLILTPFGGTEISPGTIPAEGMRGLAWVVLERAGDG